MILNGAEDLINLRAAPANASPDNWTSVQKSTKAYLRLYIKPDIYSLIASDVDLPTFYDKWEKLKGTYGGASGSTTVFNLWRQLTQCKLDDSTSMATQLAKINETRVALSNASMGITDTQFCLILLHALPDSYEVLASTILASGSADQLKHAEIIARILNEEGQRSGSTSSLNAVKAPVKSQKGKPRDHTNLTCHYCNKKGHIQPDCRKKKKDDKEKKDKEKNASSKAANTHVAVHTSASIEEINDDLHVSLYAAASDAWMLDSGATHHITPHTSDFISYSKIKGIVRLGDKSTVDQAGIGSVTIQCPEGYTITLSNVLHVPSVNTRFISISALDEKGAEVTFASGKAKILISGKLIATGVRDHKLYWLSAAPVKSNLNHAERRSTSLQIWHQRMGHMSHSALRAHGPKALKGLDFDESTVAPTVCHGCELGKSTRLPFPGSASKSSSILELVHSDLAGPMQSTSLQGSKYIATFIDDYSRHAAVYYLKSKDQFVVALKQFLVWAETQTNNKMRALQSDRGGEYVAGYIKDILVQRGIDHRFTMPNSPQQNGKAERFNRTIMDKAMSMLHHAGLSNGFWEHAICTATHVYNRSPTRSLGWRTPHEIWSGGHTPDVSYFRVFGCKAYVHVHKDDRKKLDPKAFEATFIGYEPGSKGYRLWDKRTRSVKLSRDVKFDEDQFPSRPSAEPRSSDAIASNQSHNLTPFYPVLVDTSTTLPVRAQSPTHSDNDDEDVEDLLEQTPSPSVNRPTTPPANTTNTPITPTRERSDNNPSPPRPQNSRAEVPPPPSDFRAPGGTEQPLRRSTRPRHPNP